MYYAAKSTPCLASRRYQSNSPSSTDCPTELKAKCQACCIPRGCLQKAIRGLRHPLVTTSGGALISGRPMPPPARRTWISLSLARYKTVGKPQTKLFCSSSSSSSPAFIADRPIDMLWVTTAAQKDSRKGKQGLPTTSSTPNLLMKRNSSRLMAARERKTQAGEEREVTERLGGSHSQSGRSE